MNDRCMTTMPKRLQPATAFVVGAVLFTALDAGTALVARAAPLEGMAARQMILKTAMLLLALSMMLLVGRPWRAWGFAAPRRWLSSTLLPMAAGGILGAACTATIVGLGFTPMAGLREMGLPRIIAIIWFGSTIAEEVFVRGLIQGWMQPLESGAERSTSIARILASGLLFGALHLSLFLAGNDTRTAATIVIATTLLGLVCAWSRERSGSLIGPLLSHLHSTSAASSVPWCSSSSWRRAAAEGRACHGPLTSSHPEDNLRSLSPLQATIIMQSRSCLRTSLILNVSGMLSVGSAGASFVHTHDSVMTKSARDTDK